MRIAFFSENFYPELSGVADSLLLLGKELAARGHDVHVYAPRYGRGDYEKIGNVRAEDPAWGPRITVTRFFSFPVPSGSGQGRMVIPTPFRSLTVRRFAPDVMHTQLFFGVGLEAIIASRILRVPLVGTNHTAITEFVKHPLLRTPQFTKLILKYVNWYYRRCVFTSAPSRSVLAEMEAFGFRGEGIVLSNPIDTRTFRPLPRRKTAKARYGFTDATAIYAGRLAHEKHIDVLLRAVAHARSEVPRLMLALAGGGPEERPLRTLAARLGILSAVRFLGILDKPALAEAYNASELFTITSTSETQSLTMMQALSCGLPVVAVRARALPEYINRRNGVLVPPGDAALLAREIVRLIKHPQARKTLGMGARKSAQAFSPPHIAEAWERLYQRAIGAHRHS